MNTRFIFVIAGLAAQLVFPSEAEELRGGAPEPISVWPQNPNAPTEAPELIVGHVAPGKQIRHRREFGGSWDVEPSFRQPLNGDYRALFRAMTSINYDLDDRGSLGLEAGGGVLEFERGSLAHEIARDPLVLEAGINFRHFFTHPKAFLRPYATLRLGFFAFIWDYREGIETEGDTVHMDYVWGFDPSAGMGIAIQPTRNLSVFGEAEVGAMVFAAEATERGVWNDFMDNFGYFGLRAGLRLRF